MNWRRRWFSKFLKEAERLNRYDVGLTAECLAQKLGTDSSQILKLNSNENLFIPLSFLRKLLIEAVEELDPRFYPRDELVDLRNTIAKKMGVSDEQIVIGAGSDQLIELIVYAFLRREDRVISIDPTFSIYMRTVRARRAHYMPVPLKDDFSLDIDSLLHVANTMRAKLLFLCSPNNPTANQFDKDSIHRILEGFDGIVIIDETYVDFASYSTVEWIKEFDNLIVLRTFSKVYGIAGLRLGYAISNREISSVIRRFKMPYAVSSVALRMGLKLIEKDAFIEQKIHEIKKVRSNLILNLKSLENVKPFKSDTNFVLFSLSKISSEKAYNQLLEQGIIIRKIGKVLNFKNCLRVTVAPPHIMKKFITALREVVEE